MSNLYVALDLNTTGSPSYTDVTLTSVHMTIVNSSGQVRERYTNVEIVDVPSQTSSLKEVLSRIENCSSLESNVYLLCENNTDVYTWLRWANDDKDVFDDNNTSIIDVDVYYAGLLSNLSGVNEEQVMNVFNVTFAPDVSKSERMALLFHRVQEAIHYRRYGYRSVDAMFKGLQKGLEYSKLYATQFVVWCKQQVEECKSRRSTTTENVKED